MMLAAIYWMKCSKDASLYQRPQYAPCSSDGASRRTVMRLDPKLTLLNLDSASRTRFALQMVVLTSLVLTHTACCSVHIKAMLPPLIPGPPVPSPPTSTITTYVRASISKLGPDLD